MSDLLTTHPNPEQWTAFSRGELSDPDSTALEEHIAACEACRKVVVTLSENPLAGLVRAAETSAGPAAACLRLQPGYEILEEIGRGGMGVVYKARQAGLGRTVALKRLHGGRQTRPEVLARFHREAEAIARLDHPNIVQVYEFGEQDGQPYLALEYVAGGTLVEQLTNPLPPRQAAALVETLARAMHYAHAHGIVHRDLKPGNVLLATDEHGSTQIIQEGTSPPPSLICVDPCSSMAHFSPKITDFGLARLLDHDGAQTRTGEIVGTPAYMAPEQAGGQTRAVGPAADIHALGAILYEALTGRPPFKAATVLETLEQVRTQEPVPPRRVQPKTPCDLETICLKCLHKEPARRYRSAGSLADDLHRFRAGEAILARPVPAWERGAKWARRRPAAAALIGLSGLAVAALVGGLWLHSTTLRTQVIRAEASETRALQQQARAETNYQQAREAISQMLARLNKFHASGVPQVEALRRELRQDALKFYEGIAQLEEGADPATRFDIARAYVQLGELQEEREPAQRSLERARRLLEELIAEEPANLDYQSELGGCLTRLGNKAGAHGPNEDFLRFHEQALAVYQAVCRARPENTTWQRNLAVCHLNLSCYYQGARRWSETEFHCQAVLRTSEELTRRYPEEDSYQYLLAISCTNLAMLYRDTNRLAEAEQLYGKSDVLLTELVRKHPEAKDWVWALGRTLRNWGGLLLVNGRAKEAWGFLTRAVRITEDWVREDPSSPRVLVLLLDCLAARMSSNTLLHRREEGEADWKRCLELSARLNSWSDLCKSVLLDARFGAAALAATRAEYLANQNGIKADDLYQLVLAYAVATEAAAKQAPLPPIEREQQVECYASAAVALLTRLKKEGYFKTPERQAQLRRSDPDLEALRSRPDFRQLLNGLPSD